MPETPIALAVAPTNGLVGEWKLDETGGTTAVDTKNGFNATVLGGATFVAGTLGNALNLNNGTAGTGGKYAQMPSNATLDNVQEGNYTISAWFNPITVPPDTGIDHRFWAIVSKAGQNMGLVYNSVGKFSARHYLTGNLLQLSQAPTIYPAGAWYHVAAVVSKTSGTLKIYVNGAPKDSTTFTPNTAARDYGTTPFQIGKAGTQWAADGKIDQVRIYNRDLSASEIADLFNETAGTGPTVTTNPASAITTTTARLNGSANPNGAATTGWFRYSATSPGTCNDTFGTRSPSTGGTALGSGSSAVAYNRDLAGLDGGKTYYFCAIASNSSGTGLGTVRSFQAGGIGLRFGLWAMTDIGTGPGGDMTGPMYDFTLFPVSPGDVDDYIALADQHDVVLMLNLARSRTNWAPGGQYNPQTYENLVSEFAGDTMLRRAVNQRRVLLFVVDEPNHPDFNGTISPTEVNQMGLHHKQLWPGALTFVRISGGTLAAGWAGPNGANQPPPAGGYTGLDYGWLQYSAQHITETFAQKYTEDSTALASLNMGMVPGLNWWGGGLGHRGDTSLDGVPACWDIEKNGSSSGYIVGIGSGGLPEGTRVDCGELPTAVTRTVASPAWIRRWADVVFSRTDAPFVAMWRTGVDQNTIPGAAALAARSDYVSAMDYVLTKAASRATWNGYRTPK